MVINIKNMVCLRCKMLVKNILDDMGLGYCKIDLGSVELKAPITKLQKDTLNNLLNMWGLTLIEDSKEILVEKIKNSIVNMIRNNTSICAIKTSTYLSTFLNYNYTYLANTFSEETGISLRDFIIAHRIEKAKEMLTYEGFTVTEVAWKLNYSSVAHFSNQFNKITGYSPSQFKKNTDHLFKPLEAIGIRETV